MVVRAELYLSVDSWCPVHLCGCWNGFVSGRCGYGEGTSGVTLRLVHGHCLEICFDVGLVVLLRKERGISVEN